MTVKELKQVLRGIPDETPVLAMSDYNLCSRWDVQLHEEEDDDGKYSEVIISIKNHLD